jgi:hypothetical protein
VQQRHKGPRPKRAATSRKQETYQRVWWLETGFGLVTGFIGLLQNVTPINYSAMEGSLSLHFTIARGKFSTSSLGIAMQWLQWGRLRQGATVSQQPQTRTDLSASRLSLGFFSVG